MVEFWICCCLFDDAAIRRQIASKDGCASLVVKRVVERADDLVIVNLGTVNGFGEGPARDSPSGESR